jgi:glutaminyl-tRNA synthetase
VFERVVETGNNPSAIVDELSLGMISDEAVIAALVEETFKENPDTLEKFAAGKKNVFGFIVGQILKKSGGKADPQIVNKLVTDVFQRAVPNTTE